jgi:hypothetical protein
MNTTCPATSLATITEIRAPLGKRQAIININGVDIGFWLENTDHPELPVGAQVRVSYHPDDQYAKIIC